MNKKAFTLAEILITLSILGVVAAITIPSVTTYIKRGQTETKIKKFYSTIDNLISTAEIESGERFNTWNFNDKNEILNKYFVPNLQISKNCLIENCEGYNFYRQKGKLWATFTPALLLKDGTIIGLIDSNSIYGDFVLRYDINGIKGPNKAGQDIFDLGIYKDEETGSYYLGTDDSNKNNKDIERAKRLCKTETTSGMGGLTYYSGWIYSNGFKIPKDYPWL